MNYNFIESLEKRVFMSTSLLEDVFFGADDVHKASIVLDIDEIGLGTIVDQAIDSSGRYLAVELIPQHDHLTENPFNQIYLIDLVEEKAELVSHSLSSEPGDGYSNAPSISSDGQWLAFRSKSDGLVDGEMDGQSDVFLYHRSSNTTQLISEYEDYVNSGTEYYAPSLSSNGQYVAYLSVTYTDSTRTSFDIRLHIYNRHGSVQTYSGIFDDLIPDTTSLQISDDGRQVVFSAVSADTRSDATSRIYIYDTASQERQDLSALVPGVVDESWRYVDPTMNVDGSVVAFLGKNGQYDIDAKHTMYVWHRETELVQPIDFGEGVQLYGLGYGLSLSENGRWLTFASSSDLLLDPVSCLGCYNVFLYDLESDVIVYRSDNQFLHNMTRVGTPIMAGDGDVYFLATQLDGASIANRYIYTFDNEVNSDLSLAQLEDVVYESGRVEVALSLVPVLDHLQGLLSRRFVTLDLGALDLLGRDGPVRLVPVVF